MKLTAMLMLVCCLQISAKSISQNITLKVRDVPLTKIFNEIKKQTGYTFIYTESMLRESKRVSMKVTNSTLQEVLAICFAGQPFSYQIINKTVVVEVKSAILLATAASSITPDPVLPPSPPPVEIRGRVVNEQGEPLANVSVVISGTKIGTTTNLDGRFTITVPNNRNISLEFSSVGFVLKKVGVGSNQVVVNVTLEQDVSGLSEIVVTALGIKRQIKSLGYSTTEISGASLTESRTPNLASALSGQIAGVSVAGTGTGPNGSTRVTIRGNTSLTGGTTPLYVIDGVPLDVDNQGSSGKWGGPDYGDALSTINPDDIETINVLKGAAGSALYGYRGGNGVILITTKSGSKTSGIGVTLNNNTTFSNLIDLRDFQYEYGQGSNGIKPTTIEAAQNTDLSSWGSKLDGSQVVDILGNSVPYVAHKDNFKNFYKTGVNSQTTVSLSGRNDKGNFRLGVTNMNSSEVIPNSGSDRQGINFNSSYNLSPKLHLNFTVSYTHENVKNRAWHSDPPGSVIAGTFFLASSYDIRVLNPSVDENGDEILPGGPTSIWFNNPYFVANYFRNTTLRDRYTGNITLRYDFTSWLSLQGQVTRNSILSDVSNIVPYGTGWQHSGSLDVSSSNNRELNASFMFDFNKKIGTDLSIHANLGGNHQGDVYKSSGTGGGLDLPYWYSVNNIVNHVYDVDFTEYRVNSFFGSADIGYKDYLFASVTGRNDWFSVLNPRTNKIFYPSVSTSFVFSDAFTMPWWISFGKLRASWAKSSSANASPYSATLSYSNVNVNYGGILFSRIGTNTVPNALLKPSDIQEIELGVSMSFLKNRFNIDAAVYSKNVNDDILNVTISRTSGYTSSLQNIGKMRNKGLELLLGGVPLQTRNFSWRSSVNIAFNNSKVIFLSPGVNTLVLGSGDPARFGNFSINQIVGQEYGQLMGFKYLRDDQGNKIFGDDGLPLRTDNLESLGSGVYKTTGGFSNDFRFKNFTLSSLFDFKFGAKIYSVTNAQLASMGLHKNTLAGREGGYIGEGVTEDGSKNAVAVDAQVYWQAISGETGEGVDNIEEEYVYDASFIKLRSAALSYTLPKSILKEGFIKELTVSFVGRNLAILLKHIPNIDPESNLTNSVEQGVEYNPYPPTRQLGFNINLKF